MSQELKEEIQNGDEKFEITVKGFLWAYFDSKGKKFTIPEIDDLLNALYVFLHKNGYNALVFDKGEVIEAKVRSVEDKEEE